MNDIRLNFTLYIIYILSCTSEKSQYADRNVDKETTVKNCCIIFIEHKLGDNNKTITQINGIVNVIRR